MKVGILTFFGAHNYGAFLQAYALREVLNNYIEADVELINYRSQKEVDAYSVINLPIFRPKDYFRKLREFLYNKLQFNIFEKSILKYQILSKNKLISDSVEEFVNFVGDKYDLIIAGSDEIWKVDGFRSFPNAYWLPKVASKKMAYAVSSRNLVDSLTENQKTLIKDYIAGFDYIGTRDHATYNLIKNLSNNSDKCYLNCDPAFLYDFSINKENGKQILKKKFKVKSQKKIIGLILSDTQYGQKLAECLSGEFEVVSLSSHISCARNYAGLSPFDWADVIASCDMIITSRFHGTVFSMKGSRPFLAIEMDGYSKETSKLFDLLERNGLTQFYVANDEKVSTVLSKHIPNFLAFAQKTNYAVDYKKVIETEKKMSESFVSKLREYEE